MAWSICSLVALGLWGVGAAEVDSAVLGAAGALTGRPVMALVGLVLGMGLTRVRRYRRQRAIREREERDREDLLRTVLQMSRDGIPLPVIGDELGVSSWENSPLGSDGELLSRHGGAATRVVTLLLDQLQQNRRQRWEWENAMSGPRSSTMMLAAAPWILVAALRWLVPIFYADLVGTLYGAVTLLAVAVVGCVAVSLSWREPGILP
jgi:Flp pilus assembly protein TadB